MIYLSAQPDDVYFTWQLELQIRNFHSLGTTREQIHILFAFHPVLGLNPLVKDFIRTNEKLALIFLYPDTRKHKKYTSSIRPNIIKQHFKIFPELSKQVIFYHDSDILLSRIPNIQNLYTNNTSYVSDTRNYLDSDYIKNSGSEKLLVDMANVVGLEVAEIEKNIENTGGAQYILKNINWLFWEKVECDSEKLYGVMQAYNLEKWESEYPKKRNFRRKAEGIQSWCADMWSLLWNLWYLKKTVEIHEEMVFSWPHDPVALWGENAILHYSGSQNDDSILFKKTDYVNYPPWYHSPLNNNSVINCCSPIFDAIQSRRLELDCFRIDLSNTCFIVEIDNLKEDQLHLFSIVQKFLFKTFDCHIKIYLNDEIKFNRSLLVEQTEIITKDNWFEKLKSSNKKIEQYIYFPAPIIINNTNILSLLKKAKASSSSVFIFETVKEYLIDLIFTEAFYKVLDTDIFEMNLGKFSKENGEAAQVIVIKKAVLEITI